MPFVRLETSAPLTDEVRRKLCASLSQAAAQGLGKPEQYVMTSVVPSVMSMSGTPAPAAFVDLRSIGGLSPAVNRALAKAIGGIVQETLKIPGERIFLTFTDVPGTHWGWQGSTLG